MVCKRRLWQILLCMGYSVSARVAVPFSTSVRTISINRSGSSNKRLVGGFLEAVEALDRRLQFL